MTEMELRRNAVKQAEAYVGCSKGDARHKALIDYYNANCRGQNGARNYKVSYSDSYCATAVSSWWKMANLDAIVPFECGVGEMVNLAKTMGIFKSKTYVPQIGDAIVFDFKVDGWADHIALVTGTDGNLIHTINPNNGNAVTYTDFVSGSSAVFGFICPDYDAISTDPIPQPIKTIVPRKRHLYCEESCDNPCSIQQGNIIRNYLIDTDRFDIITESANAVQVKVCHNDIVWTPWVLKTDIE